MSFNFGSLATVQPSNNNSYLKPYTINDNVVIKSTEVKEGTSEKVNHWKSLNITFGNDEGIYNDSIFWITSDKDFERTEVDAPNGGKKTLPSAWERTRDKIAAIGQAFNPTDFVKLQAAAGKLKTFDDLALNFKKILDKVIDKNPTSMKLVGRNSNGSIYATLPSCTGIAQAKNEKRAALNGVNVGDWYTWMVSPFGENLTFSAYEEKQRANIKSAKPTTMPDEPKDESGDSVDINFDELL